MTWKTEASIIEYLGEKSVTSVISETDDGEGEEY